MDILTTHTDSDFKKVRLRASLNKVFGNLLGQSAELMSFDEIRKIINTRSSVYRGTQPIKLDQIIGSLNRHHEFDRAFRPYKSISSQRWQAVSRAHYEGVSLPAISVYKVGKVYFVVDGHHRVSVAREQKQVFIDAEVREFKPNCNIASRSTNKDLKLICPA